MRQQVGYDLRPRGAAQSFDSAVEFKRSPLLSIARMSCDIGTAVRHEREISDRYTGSFIMYREDAPATNFVLRGKETLVRRGEWVIGNYDLPHTAQSATSFNYEVARFPREFILPHLPVLARGRFLKLTGRPGAEALAISYFYEIRRNWERLDEREIAEAADTLARLIGIASGARPDEHTDAVRLGRLARLKTTSTATSTTRRSRPRRRRSPSGLRFAPRRPASSRPARAFRLTFAGDGSKNAATR